MAIQLGAGVKDINPAGTSASPTRFHVLESVVGDVAGRDLFTGSFDVVQEFGGEGGGVLNQLFGVDPV